MRPLQPHNFTICASTTGWKNAIPPLCAETNKEACMKVGIVGVGFMGTTHAAGWAETPAEIVGFTAETQTEAGAISKQYDTNTYHSLEDMLPDVDVVDICSP